MAKLPSFQFYPGDWLKDPQLRRCSHHAKGVLIDMLCLMFECDDRGHLSSSGIGWTDDEICRAIGGVLESTAAGLHELVEKGVVSRSNSGTVYSRRMVRDEKLRKERISAGSAGGCAKERNARSKKVSSKPPSKRLANHLANTLAKSRSSSSSSSSSSDLRTPTEFCSDLKPVRADDFAWNPNDGFSRIGDADRTRWATAYPACDIDAELAKAHEWLLANPAKAKKSRWRKFVTNWLSRSQERGGSAPSVRPAAPKPRVATDAELKRWNPLTGIEPG